MYKKRQFIKHDFAGKPAGPFQHECCHLTLVIASYPG